MTPCTRCHEPFALAALTDYLGELICPRDLHSIAMQQMAHPRVHIPTVTRSAAPVVASDQRPRLRVVKKARGVEAIQTTGGLL